MKQKERTPKGGREKGMNIQKKLMTVRNTIKSGKDAVNSFGKYNYRNAEAMLASINPLLQTQGLTLDFSDEIVMIGARTYVKTKLTIHDTEDGESYSTTSYAREPEQKKGMDESQITGSTITYCHKYALMGMFAISDPKMDPDSMDNSNDGNGNGRAYAAPPQPQPRQTNAGWNGQAQAPIPNGWGYGR